MASPINKEGRNLGFRRGTAARNHKVENYEGFTQQKKEDARQRDSNSPLVHSDPLVHPDPPCETGKKTIKSLLSPLDFYF